jgi:hypothetical protein
MSFDVYTIDTFPASSNHYALSRGENWQTRLVQTFSTLADAENYVIDKTMAETILATFTVTAHDAQDKMRIIRLFCFDDDQYLHYRRYFVGKPPVTRIQEALVKQGVTLVN